MDYLIGSLVIIVILGYLVLTVINSIRLLRRDKVSPEVETLIQELKQLVDATNIKLDEAIKAVTQATTRYEVLQGVVSTDKQEIFSPKEELVKELITLRVQCLATKPGFLPEKYSLSDVIVGNIPFLAMKTIRPAKGKLPAFTLSQL